MKFSLDVCFWEKEADAVLSGSRSAIINKSYFLAVKVKLFYSNQVMTIQSLK